MKKNEKRKIVKTGIEVHGKEFQLIMLGEECGELLTAASQHWRGRVGKDDVVTEIADVFIMIDCIKELYGITDEEIDNKITSQYTKFRDKVNSLKTINEVNHRRNGE